MRRLALAAAALALLGVAVAPARDPIVVRARADAPAPVTDGRVDHAAWNALLGRHVDARGLVDYAAWKAGDRPALLAYLQAMAAVRPDALADDAERVAYWLNVYNALTVHGLLEVHPTRSIKDHVSLLFGFDFWDDVRLEVAGAERSLDAIEHAILRPMGEPRIHVALVCASLGCPALRTEAYAGPRLDAQLDDQARRFFADPKALRLDREDGEVRLSPILDWFGEDFGGTDRAKLDFVRRHVASEEDKAFLAREDLDVGYLDDDWRLNEQPKR